MAKKDDSADLSQDLLLKEVDEEVRAERLNAWWQKFGSWLVGGALAIVAITVTKEIINAQKQQGNEEATAYLLHAEELMKKQDYRKAFDSLKDAKGDEGLKNITLLYAAEALHKADEGEQSKRVLKDVAKEGKDFPALAHYAALQLGDVVNAKKDQPFFSTAQEMAAVQHYQDGNYAEALKALESILLDPVAAASLRDRAELLKQLFEQESKLAKQEGQ